MTYVAAPGEVPGERRTSRVRDGLITIAACLGTSVAAWLVRASVHITTWTSDGPARIALVPPRATLAVAIAGGFVAAALAIGFTARSAQSGARLARIIAPLGILWLWTLPYVPWLPDHLPALVALAGPVRWLIAGVAVGGVAAFWARSCGWHLPTSSRFGRPAVFLLSLALYAVLGLRSFALVGLGGDEPHYLVITHSLLVDHDLQIENNHANREYRRFYAGNLRPDYLRRGQNGAIYSIHSPGLSVLLLPGYALAGAPGAVLTVCLLAALAAVAVFDVALVAGGKAPALLTWISVCLAVPFVPHAWMLYPETACVTIVAWSAQWLMSPLPEERWKWTVRGAALAWLPWLHIKFVVILAALLFLLLIRLRARMKDAVALLLPVTASLIGWFAFFAIIYGTPDPQAPYGGSVAQYVRFANVPRGLLGFLFDQKFGLLVYAPAYALAAVGIWPLARTQAGRWVAAALACAAGPYLLASGRYYMWWGGASAPARFVVPVLPLLAAPISAGLSAFRGAVARAAAGLWIVSGTLVAAAGVTQPNQLLLFSEPHGVARTIDVMQGSAPLTAVLPIFTEPDWTPALARLLPWLAAAGTALCVAALVARLVSRPSTFWVAVLEAVTFVLVGLWLSGPIAHAAQSEAVARGRLDLLDAYDPNRLRGFDYRAWTSLPPPALLQAAALTIQRESEGTGAATGLFAGPLPLPPGRYEVGVTFADDTPYDGSLVLSHTRGNAVARVPGPFVTDVPIPLDIPVQATWLLSFSSQAASNAWRRATLEPVSIVPRSLRPVVGAAAVEALAGRWPGLLAYANDETYPENGVFWTRATSRGDVVVFPAGATAIALILHVGPIRGRVRLRAAGRDLDTDMEPNDTRRVVIAVPSGREFVPVSVQAPGAFRPAEVEPGSTDTRLLGCQVRVELQ
jgi:hypothetical protein